MNVDSFEIEIPLPPKECSPNYRGHWRVQGRAKSGYRGVVSWEVSQILRELKNTSSYRFPVSKIRIDALFYLNQKQGDPFSESYYFPRDEDNAIASLKAAIDGLVDAGVIANDSRNYMEFGAVKLLRREQEHKGKRCVVLTVSILKY
jgi:hypothetical protein